MTAGRLQNGLKYVIKEREDLNSVTVNVWIKTGAAYETDENRGMAHFLEHMLFNGSQNLPPGTIDKAVETMGGEINAATSYDYTYYYLKVPYYHLEDSLYILKELVFHPLLSKEMVEKEKPIVLEEIARSKDNPQEVFSEKFMENLYLKAPYRYPILGFEETVKNFTDKSVKKFYRENYCANRTVISVVGKVNAPKVEEKIESLFSTVPSSSFKRSFPEEPLEPKKESFKLQHQAVQIPQILLGWKLPPDPKDNVYYEILDALLSSGKSSLFYTEIREKGTAYSCSSNFQNLLISPNFTVAAVTDTPKECLEEIKNLFKRIPSISKEEFETAKEKLLKATVFLRESGEEEADGLGYALGVMENLRYYTNYEEEIKRADYEVFKEKAKFLLREPLVGVLYNK